jgi:hypothetical protein
MNNNRNGNILGEDMDVFLVYLSHRNIPGTEEI